MEDLRIELRGHIKPHRVPLQALRPTLALDGVAWLNTLCSADPSVRLLGGLPPNLEAKACEFVRTLKELGPKPIFLFDGLPFIQESTAQSLTKRQQTLKDIWEGLEDSRPVRPLLRIQAYSEDYCPELIAQLKAAGAECLRAPYKAAMQLAYLSANSMVGAVYGDLDLLMYDCKRIILEFDLEHKEAIIVDSSAVALTELGLSKERLMEMFILKGYLIGKEIIREEVKRLLELLRGGREGYSFLPLGESIAKLYESARVFLKSQIVSKPDKPETVPLHPQAKLDAAIGLHFQHEVYFAVSVTPLSFQLLSAVAAHRIVELPPVADSRYYRSALQRVLKTRRNCYNLLQSFLNEAFRKTDIVVQYWYGGTDRLTYEPLQPLKWVFTRAEVEHQVTAQNRQMDFVLCLKWHLDAWAQNSPLVTNLKNEEVVESPAESHKDVLCKVYFKFLEMCGFIGPNGDPMVFGKALMKAAGEFQYELFLILELLGMGLLNGHTMQQSISQAFLSATSFRALTRCPETNNQEMRHSATLVARVCSLLQPKLAAESWTGPMNYSIAQFYSIVRLLHRNYRLLLEAIILNEFCNKRFTSPELFRGLGEKLPFRAVPCSALGVVLRSLLLGKSLSEAKLLFPQCIDLKGDLERCWKLWQCVMNAVCCLRKHQSVKEKVMQDFQRADELFRSRYERLREETV